MTSGNTDSNSFDVIVQDTTDPVVANRADVTAEATGPDGAVVTTRIQAQRSRDSSLTVNCSPASGSTFALGTSAGQLLRDG